MGKARIRQYRSAVLSFIMLTCSLLCVYSRFAILYCNSTRVLDLPIKLLAKGYLYYYQRELWQKKFREQGRNERFSRNQENMYSPSGSPSILGCLPWMPGSQNLIWDNLHQGRVNDRLAQCKRRRWRSVYSRYPAYLNTYWLNRMTLLLYFVLSSSSLQALQNIDPA